MKGPLFSQSFLSAVKDYRLFLDMGYPEKDVARLVGNKFRLTKEQRMILYRGVLTTEDSAKNSAKKIKAEQTQSSIAIDGYNVLLTLVNYMLGRPVFISTDSFVRDIGGIHGKIKNQEIIKKAAQLVCGFLKHNIRRSVKIFLDRPVSHSADLKAELVRLFYDYGPGADVVLADSADYELKRHKGAVATSDSVVLAAAQNAVDLPAEILFASYSPRLTDLREYV